MRSLPRFSLLISTLIAPTLLLCNAAQAATASATVPINLQVASPNCTVSNNNASILLPAATSVTETSTQYFSANSIATAAQSGGSRVTSAALNQTATITCTVANTAILGITIKPDASATTPGAGYAQAFLVDTQGNKSFPAATWVMGTELVSITSASGTASTPWSFGTSSVSQYTTAFATGALTAGQSTASFIWRPEFTGGSTNPISTPAGGSFNTTFDIVVNY